MAWVWVINIVLSSLARSVASQTGPTHCSYADDFYECDYDKMTSSNRPIDFTQFSVQPQRLIINVNGFLPYFGDSRIFSTGFSTSSSMDVSQFDSNYPASLEVDCGWGGSAYITTGAFDDMEYVQHFKMKNCDIYYIDAGTMDALQDLDYFGIEGGTIDTIDPTAMAGLTVEKLSSAAHQFPRNLGRLEVTNAKFVNNIVNPELLTFFSNVTSVIIKNADVASLTSGLFRYNPLLRLVDLSDNLFTKFPGGFLTDQSGLSEIMVYNIDWECSCENLWWLQNAINSNTTIKTDGMCADLAGTTIFKYYYENCADGGVCEGIVGVAMGEKCVTLLGLIVLCLAFSALILTIVALALAIVNLRNLPEKSHRNKPVDFDSRSAIARKRWKDVTRKIIQSRRSGRQIGENMHLESEGSKTMSIPDETRSHGRSSRIHSIGSTGYADFPSNVHL